MVPPSRGNISMQDAMQGGAAAQFSVGSAIEYANKTFVRKFPFLFALQLPLTALSLVGSCLPPQPFGPWLAALCALPLAGGFAAVQLGLVDGREPVYAELFSKAGLTGKVFLLNLCVNTAMVLGYFCLLVPGVLATIHFAFCMFCLVEDNKSPLDAMRRSSQLSKGYRWQVFGLFWVMVLAALVFGIVGGIFLGVPSYFVGKALHLEFKHMIRWTVPIILMPVMIWVQLISAHAYRQLTLVHGQKSASEAS
ncbi:MAG: hypothetical protein JST01_13210 [Cyanobacteria bacterium SZAS TMP-1]|nr:hypothetical protein [Cyanobacteria bacterium SZAS TMP-1]